MKKTPAQLDAEIAEALGQVARPNTEEAYFSSNDVKGVVTYRGKTVAIRTSRGWTPIDSESANVNRAVRAAIFSMPNDVSASELRHEITERV